MSSFVPGVIVRRANVTTFTANVANVAVTHVSSLVSGTEGVSNVILADWQGKLLPSTITNTALSYLGDVTSSIQSQLDGKLDQVGGSLTANNVTVSNALTLTSQTASRVLITDATSNLSTSAVTTTELGYLSNVTSAIQTQLDAKANLTNATFTGSVTVDGNLTVLGNLTTLETEQLVVEDPVIVINSGKLNQATGLYLEQASGNAAALVFQGGNVELITTATAANSSTYTPSSYSRLVAGDVVAKGNAAVTGVLSVQPATTGYMSSASGSFNAAANVHLIPLSAIDAAHSGTGIFGGQLMVFVTNSDTTANNKTGFALVSLVQTPADFDVVPLSVHRSAGLEDLAVGKATGNVVVTTDADCSISWKFDGGLIA